MAWRAGARLAPATASSPTTSLRARGRPRPERLPRGRCSRASSATRLPDVVFLPADGRRRSRRRSPGRARRATPVTVRGAASTALGGCGAVRRRPHARPLAPRPRRRGRRPTTSASWAPVRACARSTGASPSTTSRCPCTRPTSAAPSPAGSSPAASGLNAFGRRRAARHRARRRRGAARRRARALPRRRPPRRARPTARARGHREVAADEAEAWFRGRGLRALRPRRPGRQRGHSSASSCSSCCSVGRRPNIGAFLLEFRHAPDAFAAAERIIAEAGRTLPRPANLKLVLGSHLRHAAHVWADEDARAWRRLPSGALRRREACRGRAIDGPRGAAHAARVALGRRGASSRRRRQPPTCTSTSSASRAARAFAARLAEPAGRGRCALADESVRFAAERFRPQQNKRFGPGLLAAEIVLPARRVLAVPAQRLPPRAPRRRRARPRGLLPRRRRGARHRRLPHRPPRGRPSTSTSCCRRRCSTSPCSASAAGPTCSAAGRRRSPSTASAPAGSQRLRGAQARPRPAGPASTAASCSAWACAGRSARSSSASTGPACRLARRLWSTPGLRRVGRASRARVLARAARARARGAARRPATAAAAAPAARAIHCVNCGECNSVCPVYDASGDRACRRRSSTTASSLHAGARAARQRRRRCSTCACAAATARRSARPASRTSTCTPLMAARGRRRPRRYEHARHAAARWPRCAAPPRYRDALPRRAPGHVPAPRAGRAPGAVRFRVLRAENDAGPAATCLHCAACVPVVPHRAPTASSSDADARLVTTDEYSCIGCGACVEVCPANRNNGGQTLRVVEAPTAAGAGGARRVRKAGGGPVTTAEQRARGDGRAARRRAAAAAPPGDGRLAAVGGPARLHRRSAQLAARARPASARAALLAHLLAPRRPRRGRVLGPRPRAPQPALPRAPSRGASRAVPALELTAFDIDKLLKERFRREPLTRRRRLAPRLLALATSATPPSRTPPTTACARSSAPPGTSCASSPAVRLPRRAAGGALEELRAAASRHAAHRRAAALRRRRRPRARLPRGDRSAPTRRTTSARASLVVIEADTAAAHAARAAAARRATSWCGSRRGTPCRRWRRAARARATLVARRRASLELVRAARIVELDPWSGAASGGDAERRPRSTLAAGRCRAVNPRSACCSACYLALRRRRLLGAPRGGGAPRRRRPRPLPRRRAASRTV